MGHNDFWTMASAESPLGRTKHASSRCIAIWQCHAHVHHYSLSAAEVQHNARILSADQVWTRCGRVLAWPILGALIKNLLSICKTFMFAWNMMMAWFQQNCKLHVRFCDTLWKFCCALASSKAGTVLWKSMTETYILGKQKSSYNCLNWVISLFWISHFALRKHYGILTGSKE